MFKSFLTSNSVVFGSIETPLGVSCKLQRRNKLISIKSVSYSVSFFPYSTLVKTNHQSTYSVCEVNTIYSNYSSSPNVKS